MAETIKIEQHGRIAVVIIARPERRNAVDAATAMSLYDTFKKFDSDAALDVAILTGADGNFCAGADLHEFAGGRKLKLEYSDDLAPMGCTRLRLSKPVIAAIEGYAVAGGIELALWCDLRVASRSAILGVFCRRFGVPLIDLGTIRLPRLIGHGRAMDLILTGRAVAADEALQMGLVNRVVETGDALHDAIELAEQLCAFPQACMRSDRLSTLEQWELSELDAIKNEFARGLATIQSGETLSGAARFSGGEGRHGNFKKE
jgi:enoyl-CoA hydratase